MLKFLFSESLTKGNRKYNVNFHVTENDEVVAAIDRIEESNTSPMCRHLQLVDLFGRITHVPRKVLLALHFKDSSEHHARIIKKFKRICMARLNWSYGCVPAI